MRRLTIIILFIIPLLTKGWAVDYSTFSNVTMPREANVSMIASIGQDSDGLIWLGTNCGLFSYDGYTMNYHSQRVCGSHIYCVTDVKGDALYVGTDYGLWAFDYRIGDFRDWLEGSPNGVRSIVRDGDILWLGTASGLFSYHLKTKKFTKHGGEKLGNEVIYALLKTSDNNIYIGTYNGLYYYDRQRGHFRNVSLPVLPGKSNVFVNALIEDKKRKCIWIGTGGRLYRYGTTTNQMVLIPELEHNSIKSFAIDNEDRLLVGTDNGLYIYQDTKPIQHIQHDSRYTGSSLINDVVWCLLNDMDGNLWIGTDEGISISREKRELAFTSVSSITGLGMGNHFYHILQDKNGILWLGGSDGLIRTTPDFKDAEWFRVDNPRAEIAHNRIRKIYEDNEGDLWICTDGGVHYWDKNHWRHFNLKDAKSGRNANWAYDIYEDKQGRMWVACFMGGLMVVDKRKLIASNDECQADINILLSGEKGLKPFQIAEDGHQDLWVLYYDDGIRRINTQTMKAEQIEVLEKNLSGEMPSYIYTDSDSRLWIGLPNRVLCFKDSIKTFRLGYQTNGNIEWITTVGEAIWVGTRTDIWSIEDNQIQRIETQNIIADGAYYGRNGEVYLGGVDGVYHSSPESFKPSKARHPILLTSIYVDNQPKNCLNTNSSIINFSPDERHIDFVVSDFPYGQTEKSQYLYRLKDIDTEWNALPKQSNRITFNNLDYGKYILEVSRLGASGSPEATLTIPFMIQHPWYLRWWAYTLYVIILLAFVGWCFMFYRIRNRLRYERMEKEHILEQLRLKMEIQPDLRQAAEVAESQSKVPETIETLSPADEKFLSEITSVIESRISDSDLNVQSLCEQVGLGNKLVYRKLKQLTGKTPVEYIRSIRLGKAAALLKQKKFTISEVMYLSGFSNASYFSKCFQAVYNKTPREYMEQL